MNFSRLVNSKLAIRVIGTIIMLIIAFWLIINNGLQLYIGVSVLVLIGCYEFYKIAQNSGAAPYSLLGTFYALIFVANAYFEENIIDFGTAIFVVISLFWVVTDNLRLGGFSEKNMLRAVTNLSWTIIGSIYIGGFLSYIILLREINSEPIYLALVVIGAVACDSAAYFIGFYFGRHKFFSHISAKKTWEGVIAGIISSIVFVSLAGQFWGLEIWYTFGLGLVIGLSVIIGDLIESKFKRNANMKDSGSLIPAQGGLLDVIDGLMVAAVTSYFYLVFI